MQTVNLLRPFRSERGIALPTAMIALMLLTTLLIAFAVLSKSEPTIASNQARTSQARALAEAGAERAVWALTSTIIPNPMAGTIATAPYDGVTYVALGTIGGFFVTVRPNGTAANERVVDAVGWAPAYSSNGYTSTGAPTAHKRVRITLNTIKWLDPPAALSVRGDLTARGSVSVTASDTSCGNKSGSYTTGLTQTQGAASITGAGGNTDQSVPSSQFDTHIFSDADLNMLKALAQQNGTYYKGNQTFGSGGITWPASGGIVFVDTLSGNNLSCDSNIPTTCTNPSSDFITATIAGAGGNPPLNGWLIVNGSINWSGNYGVNGLVYAQNDLVITGTPTVNGGVISRNIRDVSLNNLETPDTELGGNLTINYNCGNAKTGGGTIPSGWYVKTGTYREVSD